MPQLHNHPQTYHVYQSKILQVAVPQVRYCLRWRGDGSLRHVTAVLPPCPAVARALTRRERLVEVVEQNRDHRSFLPV